MKDTILRNPDQLGRAIRLKRREKNLAQSALAAQLGVGRKWIIGLESGNPKAELGLVLRTLDALDLRASLSDESQPAFTKENRPEPSRLEEVFRHLQRTTRK